MDGSWIHLSQGLMGLGYSVPFALGATGGYKMDVLLTAVNKSCGRTKKGAKLMYSEEVEVRLDRMRGCICIVDRQFIISFEV
ncbi:uncharacterized protein BJX67DRAFT_357200 [Aspergillus lucknowensis]|uniref:Uncharacterized protein n=1 Tax=Aspergillus lucknowensis TaxID=176173 RepID=A0ABR4LNS9_9EURO